MYREGCYKVLTPLLDAASMAVFSPLQLGRRALAKTRLAVQKDAR